MYYVLLSDGSYFTGCYSQDTDLVGSVICNSIPPIDNPKAICSYRYNGLGWDLDEGKYQAVLDAENAELILEQINQLKQQLSDSDPKIIKCYEAQLIGKPLPYDINSLIADRQSIRDQINQLELL